MKRQSAKPSPKPRTAVPRGPKPPPSKSSPVRSPARRKIPARLTVPEHHTRRGRPKSYPFQEFLGPLG